MQMLDQAMEAAARERAGPDGSVETMDLHTCFMKSAADGLLTPSARVTGGGRAVCFCEADVRSPSGQVVATAMGTYRARKAGSAPEAPCT